MLSYSPMRLVRNHLDPEDRLQETLCGLIMMLTFTLIAGLTVGAGRQGVRELLLAALGCNTAWGIIDGALYIMGNLTARREHLRLLNDIRNAPSDSEAFSVISNKFGPLLEPSASTEDRTQIWQVLRPVLSRIQLPRAGITRKDVLRMSVIFLINLGSAIPAVLPFLVFSEPHFALRVSNTLLIASLFAVGFVWGRYTGFNQYVAGCCTMLIGLALVGIAIALGG